VNPVARYYHISQTQLSVARYYGGCTINDSTYVYMAADDSLVREDVLRKDKKLKKQHAKEEAEKWGAPSMARSGQTAYNNARLSAVN